MSCIIKILNGLPSVRLAQGVVGCHDGSCAGLWPYTHTMLCCERTANAVGDLRSDREGVLFMYPANGNTGKVGVGSRTSFGGIVRGEQ